MAEPLSRSTVVATARALIEEKGLRALSLRAISGRLGVTAPALYAYVTDKEDLLRAVAESEFTRLIEVFETVVDPDPLERVRTYSRVYVEYALENPELWKAMFLFPPDRVFSGMPEVPGLPIASQAYELPMEALRAAQEAGQLPAGLDPALAALTLWTATHGAAEVLLLGLAFDEAASHLLIETLLDTVIAGLAAHGSEA